jgi:hypothetical protein
MTWTLHGLGSLQWPEVARLCTGMTCAWADYDGFHEGACPDAAPPYSHVWGWATGRYIRVRVDGEHGVVGVLVDDTATDVSVRAALEASQAMPPEEDVEIAVTVATNVTSEYGAGTTLLRVIGPLPLTFVGGRP